MGIPVLILGESGTGKSCSLRNFTNDDIAFINVMSKPLPFRSDIKPYNTDNYDKVFNALKEAPNRGKKTIIIDDAQYLMANEAMNRSKEQGYQKWSEIANHFYQLLLLIRQLPEDVIVYLLAHTETDANGKERFKTVGKLMDSYSIEGVCTICLKTMVDDGYYFTTQNNGYDTVKSPMGLFQTEKIDNDLKAVDTAIRDYYNIPIKSTKKTNKKEG